MQVILINVKCLHIVPHEDTADSELLARYP